MYSNRRQSRDDEKESSKYRMSSDDRAKEILSKYKSPSSSVLSSIDTGMPMRTLRSQWEKMMETDDLEEMNSPVAIEKKKSDFDTSSLSSDDSPKEKQLSSKKNAYLSNEMSSTEDSLEISETDLQVGAFAKKLAEGKTNDRRMRSSAESTAASERNHGPHITASPQAISAGRTRFDADKHPKPFPGQSVISSIMNSNDDHSSLNLPHGDMVRFGSVGISDGDLLNTLTGASKRTATTSSPSYDLSRRKGSYEDHRDHKGRDLDSMSLSSTFDTYGESRLKDVRCNDSRNLSYASEKTYDDSMQQSADHSKINDDSESKVQMRFRAEDDEDDDEVYSFNEFDDAEIEESNMSLPQLRRAHSNEVSDIKALSIIETKKVIEETPEEVERRQRMEAILSRWTHTDKATPTEMTPASSTLDNRKDTSPKSDGLDSSNSINQDYSSDVFTNKSGNRAEDETPLNDLDNFSSADSADNILTPSPMKIFNPQHQKNHNHHHQQQYPHRFSPQPTEFHGVDDGHRNDVVDIADVVDSNVAIAVLHDLDISNHEDLSENVSNLISPTDAYRQSYRAANRYSDVDGVDDDHDFPSPPAYESNPQPPQLESFPPHGPQHDIGEIPIHIDDHDDDDVSKQDESYYEPDQPVFLKRPSAPPSIYYQGEDKQAPPRPAIPTSSSISASSTSKPHNSIIRHDMKIETSSHSNKNSHMEVVAKLSPTTAAKIRQQKISKSVRHRSSTRGSSSSSSYVIQATKSASRKLIPENSRLLLARRQAEHPLIAKRDTSPALPISSSNSSSSKSLGLTDPGSHMDMMQVPTRPSSAMRSTRSNSSIPIRKKSPKPSSSSTSSSKKVGNPAVKAAWEVQAEETLSSLINKEQELSLWEDELRTRQDEYNAMRASQIMLQQQQESFAEEVLLKQHVMMLEDDVDDLKAKLYEITEERDKLIQDYDDHHHDHVSQSKGIKRHVTATIINPHHLKDEHHIMISKMEFEELIHERDSQEQLLSGYQRENEKLVNIIKKHDHDDKIQKALYYDQQEMMNKELNRLRNMTKGMIEKDVHHHHDHQHMMMMKSYSQFRSELNVDNHILYLQDEMMSIKHHAGEKEKELHDIIDKLRKDYRQLAEQSSSETSYIHDEYQVKLVKIQHDYDHQSSAMKDMMKKIEWYQQNQVIIDEISREKKVLQQETLRLKRENKRLSSSTTSGNNKTSSSSSAVSSSYGRKTASLCKSKAQMKMILDDDDHHDDDNDHSMMSSVISHKPPPPPSSSVARHPHDIKKIKELEIIIKDLNESLQKRYPDSVSGIIRAASYHDNKQHDMMMKYEDDIKLLSCELEETRNEYQRNLRSIRQEYEHVKLQYDVLLKSRQDTTSSSSSDKISSSSVHVKANDLPSLSSSSSNVKRSILSNIKPITSKSSQAMSSSNTPHQQQLHQAQARIKELEDEVAKLHHQHAREIDDMKIELQHTLASHHQHDDRNDDYHDKMKITELVSMLEEAQKRIIILEQQLSSSSSSIPPPPPPPSSHNRLDMEYIHSLQQQHELELTRHHQHASSQLQQMLHDRDHFLSEAKHHYDESLHEQQRLYKLWKDEETRSSSYHMQLQHLHRDHEVLKNTPVSSQLHMVEDHVRMLEQRLLQREKELSSAIDDSKLAGKMELARLQAIHGQEMRDKDEELQRFQHQLEQLVSSLRGMQTMVAV